MESHTLTAGWSAFEFDSVLTGAAALALWPRNADRMLALDALAAALLASPQHWAGTRHAVAADWTRWLTLTASRAVREVAPDGICPSPSCVQGLIFEQPRLLLGGFLDAPEVLLPMWAAVLQELSDSGDEPASRGLRLLDVATVMSDRIVAAAEVGGAQWPAHDRERHIHIPDQAVLERLGGALTFTEAEFAQLAPVAGELIAVQGHGEAWKPLCRLGDRVIVARPLRLLLAALVHAVGRAAAACDRDTLEAAVHRHACPVLTQAAASMDWRQVATGRCAVRALVDVDLEALMIPVLALDDLDVETADARPALDASAACSSVGEGSHPRRRVFFCLIGDGRPLIFRSPDPEDEQPVAPVIRLGDMRLLGDAFRRDPLGIERALELMPPAPWPAPITIVDLIGVRRALEDIGPGADLGELDGVENLYERARLMSGRHPAPSPDGSGWVGVNRWPGTVNDAIFAADEDLGCFALLVRAPEAYTWVLTAGPADRSDLDGTVCVALALWLAELHRTGWRIVDDAEYALRITVEFTPDAEDAITIASEQGGPRLMFGPRFVQLMCQPDNSADRLLLTCLLQRWSVESAAHQIVDLVAPPGRGTLLMWPDPAVTRSPPIFTPPEPVTRRELRRLHRGVLDDLPAAEQQLDDLSAGELLSRMTRAVVGRIDRIVDDLRPDALPALIAVAERANRQALTEAITLPARAQLRSASETLGPGEASGEANVALRWCVERLSAQPLTGDQPLTLARELEMRAAAQCLLLWGHTYDALLTEGADCRVILSSEWGIVVDLEGPLADGHLLATEQMAAAAPELMAGEHREWWGRERLRPPAPDLHQQVHYEDYVWTQLDQAMSAQWGVAYEQVHRLLRAATDIASDREDSVAIISREALAVELMTRTGLDRARITALFDRFVLGPVEAYDPFAKAHRPWQTNRERSYLRRPLVSLDDDRLAFSAQHLFTAMRYLHELVISGRLTADGTLRLALGQLSQSIDLEFEQELAARCQQHGFKVLPRVIKLAGKKIERQRGQTLGDIDVLAWSSTQRRVLLLDAKRIAPGLPPLTVARQFREFSRLAQRHAQRRSWVVEHRDDLSAAIGEVVDDDWVIEAALVLERAVPGALMNELAVAVWPWWELVDRLNTHPRTD